MNRVGMSSVETYLKQLRVISVISPGGKNFDEKLAKARFITVLNIICVEKKSI